MPKSFSTETKLLTRNCLFFAISVYILKILNNIAAVKIKVLCYNGNPFMDKSLRKAIMTRSRRKNKISRINSAENWNNYKEQINFYLKLPC